MPDVTVVIPTRNRVASLESSVASVLAQDGVDLELVVVDDGSTDGTAIYLAQMSSVDDRVRIIRNRESVGASTARNRGARQGRASLLAFNDDDCVWEPDKLQLQMTRMTSSGAGVVYCREAVLWPELGVVVNGSPDAERRGAVRSLVTANYIGTVGPLIERRLFEEAGGFDESLPRLQEWDLWLRLGFLTSFAYVPRILVRGRAMPGGISDSSAALARASRLMLDKWKDDERMSRRDLALLHYGIGKYLLSDGQSARAREAFRDGLHIDPSSPLNWVGVFASVLPPGPFNLLKKARIHARRLTE